MRFSNQPFYLLSLLLICASVTAPAAKAADNKSGMGFGAHFGAHMGFGKAGTENSSVQDRTIGAIDLQTMPSFRYNALMLGLMLEYRVLGQLDDATKVGNLDLSGNEFMYGPGIAAHFSSYKTLFVYILKSRYGVSNPSLPVHDQVYSSGSGFELIFGYEVAPSWYFDFLFSQINYSKTVNDNLETDISANHLSHWNFGFGASYSF